MVAITDINRYAGETGAGSAQVLGSVQSPASARNFKFAALVASRDWRSGARVISCSMSPTIPCEKYRK
jgi:hypothetical protein